MFCSNIMELTIKIVNYSIYQERLCSTEHIVDKLLQNLHCHHPKKKKIIITLFVNFYFIKDKINTSIMKLKK